MPQHLSVNDQTVRNHSNLLAWMLKVHPINQRVLNPNDMQKKELSFDNLLPGEVVSLAGMDLAMVRFVREKKSEKERKDGLEPLTYYHFSIGGRGFTIDSNDMDSVELLRDKARRATVAQLMLEATEHQVAVLDDNLVPIEGQFDTRKSFRFISVVTTVDALAYVKNAGQLAKEQAIWEPKDNVAMAEIAKLIDASVTNGIGSLKAQLKAELAEA